MSRLGRLHRRVCAAMPPQLDPHIVAAARGNHRKAVAGRGSRYRQFVLDGAEIVESSKRVVRQELSQHSGHGVEVQSMGRKLDRARRRDDVRPFADVHHQRVAVGADDCGK